MPLIAVQDIFLGLGINFIQWIPLRSYNDTQFVAVTLFVVTPECPILPEVEYIKRLNEKSGNFLTTFYFRNKPTDCS